MQYSAIIKRFRSHPPKVSIIPQLSRRKLELMNHDHITRTAQGHTLESASNDAVDNDGRIVAQQIIPSMSVATAGLSLTRNFSWTLAANLVYSGCQWAILVVIAKMGTVTMVGEFAFALALVSPVVLFANQALRALLATDAQKEFRFADYLGYRLVSTAFALVIIFLLFSSRPYRLIILSVSLAKALDAIADIFYGLYQLHDRMDWTARSMFARAILSVVFTWTLMAITRSVAIAVIGISVSTALVLLGYDIWQSLSVLQQFKPVDQVRPHGRGLFEFLKPSIHPAIIKKIALSGVPLGLAVCVNSLSSNIPRYFLERYAGAATLGIFAANVYFMIAGGTVVGALAESCVARLSRLNLQRDDARFSRLMWQLTGIGFAIGAAGVLVSSLWGQYLLRIFYRPEYAARADVLVIAMIAAAANYVATFGGTALTAIRFIKIQPFIFGGCALVACCLCVLVVPRLGILGASWALVGTALFQLFANFAALYYARSREQLFMTVA
jgi:O-antigen/teichoic acid export membrane protein